MENKYLLSIGGRVVLSARCERRIETTSCNQTINNLRCVGLDTANDCRLLNQRGIL